MERSEGVILGITGGVAVGKSTVAKILAERGAAVVSADELAREVVAPGSKTLRILVAYFGTDILRRDGTLDRQVLGDIVFGNEEKRSFLNAVTHAAIAELAVRRLGDLEARGAELIVYESPLLFEAKAEGRVDLVLVVKAPEKEQRDRLLRRPGMTAARAQTMIAAQMSQQEKASRGDFVIETDGTLKELEEKVDALLLRLRELISAGFRSRRVTRPDSRA
ncbi:MAG: dephospho-CoA kinase [Deltaproteobacteria bacterium]|nr:dephospho-CoA kinase [Deltaproteobacteria bacterium]